ncbi:hypothetical protein [Streptomonospora salina]|uniref:Uncharacterized protein HemY n=1 Tax=Streptomonospora salina TaxID=104205 RepID=A0A841E7S8_9ACTN|nr:hypothetical protein [Streptomonospora salina]MBB5997178.1 uncharacterized protein HemY [Streptomonospora salina]
MRGRRADAGAHAAILNLDGGSWPRQAQTLAEAAAWLPSPP